MSVKCPQGRHPLANGELGKGLEKLKQIGIGNNFYPPANFSIRQRLCRGIPFPAGLTPDIPAADHFIDPRAQAIAFDAARLSELRERRLNPADLVRREPEVVPGYPTAFCQ